MKILILIASLVSQLSFAVPEVTLEKVWLKKVHPHFLSMTKGEMSNAQGMNLKYWFRLKKNAHKSLVIVPGQAEPAVKYAEVIYDLKDLNINIFIMDVQGQGESERLLKDSHKGHVLNFNHYVQDMEQFMNEVVLPHSTVPVALLAHSMGSAISAQYINRNPGVFEKVALSAPMFQINTKPYSETVARYLAKFLVAAGKGNGYAPDRGPYIPENDRFETNRFTRSLARFNISKFIFVNWPSITVGGPTSRWVNESLKITKHIDSVKVDSPVLILQAGKDLVVKSHRQNLFCEKHDCTMKIFPDAQHEILMEKDSIREVAMKEIKLFLGL